ncbi:MAG: amidohydrolase family protein [Nitratireductor sp.]|nr:amidohydrolase family protein [Nitratireductor sp.]
MTFTSYPVTFFGNVVLDDAGTIGQNYYLTLETGNGKNGKILYLGVAPPSQYASGDHYTLAANQLIYPGLLNLHTHVTWNFIPLWHGGPSAPTFTYDNRFEWQAPDCDGYHENVSAPEYFIEAWLKAHPPAGSPLSVDILLSAFSELQAVCGGTTVIQESKNFAYSPVHDGHILIRSTADQQDMDIPPQMWIDSAVKFYQACSSMQGGTCQPVSDAHPADTSSWAVDPTPSLSDWQQSYNAGTLYSALVHLSEGRFGFLNGGTKDAYSRHEFLAFKTLVESLDPTRFTASRFNMIHACGIDPSDADDIAFLRNYGISVLWSPVSNMMLYSDTLNLNALLSQGINCVLTSDWSPSGSKHVWDEAKHAEVFLTSQQGMSQGDARRLLYRMMTVNAAAAIGKQDQMALLQEGRLADMFVLSLAGPVAATDNAVDLLFEANDSQTSGVYTGGMLVLADTDNFTPPGFSGDFQPLPAGDGPSSASKYVNFAADGSFPGIDVTALAGAIDQAFATGGTVQVGGKPYVIQPGQFQRSKLFVTDDTPYETYMASLENWIRAQSH